MTLDDLLLTEAVKDLEADTPLRDDAALTEAAAASDERERRIVLRARRLAAETGLDRDVRGLRDRATGVGLLLAGAVLLLGLLVALGLLGSQRQINALAVMLSLIFFNGVGILLWAFFALGGAQRGAGVWGGALGALARHRRLPASLRRVWPAALRVLAARRLTAWALGGLNHLLWALVYGAAALILTAVFAFSAYRLGWETTILAPQTLGRVAEAIAWLPERIGLPAPVPEYPDDQGASRALGQWLITGTLVYGVLPRALLVALCGAVLWRRRRGGALDLDDPYYRRLIARFEAIAPTRVLDGEHAHDAAPHGGAAADAEPGTRVLIGFELPAEIELPAMPGEGLLWQARADGALDERRALLRRLAERPPERLLLACHAPSTPDRGTLRFIEAARAGRIELRLLPPPDAAQRARWRDWLAAAGRADIVIADEHD
ncbi:DUF2868 domain-containing protein [Piscinibacter sp.]|uniref:DUF2868 domain-containing protein n=1 Tax=Piscinibacter sp. TaxID=1903157 RepID=UPI0039E49863